jgi:hypothetical protein
MIFSMTFVGWIPPILFQILNLRLIILYYNTYLKGD